MRRRYDYRDRLPSSNRVPRQHTSIIIGSCDEGPDVQLAVRIPKIGQPASGGGKTRKGDIELFMTVEDYSSYARFVLRRPAAEMQGLG